MIPIGLCELGPSVAFFYIIPQYVEHDKSDFAAALFFYISLSSPFYIDITAAFQFRRFTCVFFKFTARTEHTLIPQRQISLCRRHQIICGILIRNGERLHIYADIRCCRYIPFIRVYGLCFTCDFPKIRIDDNASFNNFLTPRVSGTEYRFFYIIFDALILFPHERIVSIAAVNKTLFRLLHCNPHSPILQIFVRHSEHFSRPMCDFDIRSYRIVTNGGKYGGFDTILQNAALLFEFSQQRFAEQGFRIFFVVDNRFRKRFSGNASGFHEFFGRFAFSRILTQFGFRRRVKIHTVYPFLLLRQKYAVIRFPFALLQRVFFNEFAPPRVVPDIHLFLRFSPLYRRQQRNIVKLPQCVFMFRLCRIHIFHQFDFIRVVQTRILYFCLFSDKIQQLFLYIRVIGFRRTGKIAAAVSVVVISVIRSHTFNKLYGIVGTVSPCAFRILCKQTFFGGGNAEVFIV